MVDFNCEKCGQEIVDYKQRVQVVDLKSGMTHTYCGKCGDEHNQKIRASDASIAETGKPGHLGSINRGSSYRF